MTATRPEKIHPKRPCTRRGERGAIFVEAIIVIASFTLMFMGMVFFRLLYVNSTITSRLARGGAIAYSMSGCDSVAPKDWIGTDAKKYTVDPPNAPSNDTVATKESTSPQGSNEASSATSKIPGLGGKGFLNPIGEVSDETNVTTYTAGSFGRQKTVFQTHLAPRSYVTCGDVVRDGDFDEVFGYVKDAFGGKL
ncbi:MAG TPA: TadE family protein [Polyangiaceae bacterium]|nr:TadE family protein [Polyangiaceae bacterium]